MLICIPTSKSKVQHFINQAYVSYVVESGYEPVLTPQDGDPLKAVKICDGLLLPGGVDIDPTFYGEDNIHSLSVDPEKDDFERSLLHAFVGADKPVFGICRGFQLIIREYHKLQKAKSPVRKNTPYYQHINNHSLATELDLMRGVKSHSVYADRSFLYGEKHKTYKKMFVNSMHHQALLVSPVTLTKISRKLGGLVITATTSYGISESKSLSDHRVVEAFVINDWGNSRIAAVQWHPEELKDITLLKTFFDDKNGEQLENPKPIEAEVEEG